MASPAVCHEERAKTPQRDPPPTSPRSPRSHRFHQELALTHLGLIPHSSLVLWRERASALSLVCLSFINLIPISPWPSHQNPVIDNPRSQTQPETQQRKTVWVFFGAFLKRMNDAFDGISNLSGDYLYYNSYHFISCYTQIPAMHDQDTIFERFPG